MSIIKRMLDRAFPRIPSSPNPPLPIGTVVEPWGEIGAVLVTEGERYYMLTRGKSVSMMPWQVIEKSGS